MEEKNLVDETDNTVVSTESTEQSVDSQNKIRKKSLNYIVPIGLVILGVLIIVGSLVIDSISHANAKKIQNLINEGNNYLLALDYEQAIAAFEEAIKIDPKSVDAYVGLSDVYVAMAMDEVSGEVTQEEQYDVADSNYEKALEALETGYVETNSEMIQSKIEEITTLQTNNQANKKKYLEAKEEQLRKEEEEKKLEELEKQEQERKDEEKAHLLSMDTDLNNVAIGEVVQFGHKKDYSEPLKWIVLDIRDGYALLFADDIVEECAANWCDKWLNKYIGRYLFDEEINRIKETDVYEGSYPIVPNTNWKKIYTGNTFMHGDKGDAIPYCEIHSRRYADNEMNLSSGKKWFLLNWEDINQRLVNGKNVIDVNCEGTVDVSMSEDGDYGYISYVFDTNIPENSWLIGNYLVYQMRYKFFGEYRLYHENGEEINEKSKQVVISCTENEVYVSVIDDENVIGIRPAMWVSINNGQ